MKLVQWILFALGVCSAEARLDRRTADILKTTIIPSTAASGDITADFISDVYGLDQPQLSAVNSTSFDWWYFDAVSDDLKTSICIVFYTAFTYGFPFLPVSDSALQVGFYASFADGTTFTENLDATEAIVVTYEQGSSGTFCGTGASWIGSGDDGVYVVTIDAPEKEIIGNFQLYSKTPAHYPCGPAVSGQNLEVGPNIGWSNAVPDATGEIEFLVNGSSLLFSGAAYHDKNWSDQSFQDNVASWYWGHARLGEYSIVWFDFLALNGTEYVSAYVSIDDTIVVSTCTAGSIVIRPWGGDDTYPPTILDGLPAGFSIEIDLSATETLTLNVTASKVVLDGAPLYTRWLGSLTGSVNGGDVITGGMALFEQFKMTE